jgi:nucleotide-binding universal stress UspA family protein
MNEPRPREPFARVLVPTDFSEPSERALRRVALLPLAPAAQVELLHVLPAQLAPAIRAQVEGEATRRLAESVRLAADAGLEVRTRLARGTPFVEIVRRSRVMDADLIVVGAHRERRFHASVPARVIRAGDVPVLVVSLQPDGCYRRPLVTTDLGDASARTAELARRILTPEVRAIPVVHAYDVPFESLVAPVRDAATHVAYCDACEGEAREGLARFLALVATPDVDWELVLQKGEPRVTLLREILRRRADLVVLGTHGRGGVAHALLGSVAEWLVAEAPADLLIARPVRFTFELP